MEHSGIFRKLFPRFAALCGAALLALTGAAQYYARSLPDHIYTRSEDAPTVSALLPLSLEADGQAG